MLIRAIGHNLKVACSRKFNSLNLGKLVDNPDFLPSGDIAALVYLWNPFTIFTCVGSSTSPIEDFFILLTLYGACKRLPPLAAFGWVVSSHVALYPAILVIPVIFLLGYGPDSPPRKLFSKKNPSKTGDDILLKQSAQPTYFSWTSVVLFFLWASIFASCVLFLCGLYMKEYGGLQEMIQSLVFVIADFATAMLIRAIGHNLKVACCRKFNSLNLGKLVDNPDFLPSGDIAALVYLWNPFTIFTCVGSSTSPIENFFILLTLYGACKRLPPLAAFGWVVSSHVALYPAILVIPVIFLLGYGPDSPPRKLFSKKNPSKTGDDILLKQSAQPTYFSWTSVVLFFLWASLFASCVLFLCGLYMKEYGGLQEMIQRTYGFMLTVEDLSPNIGVLWYFFAEVFDFFRNFFLIVFHVNILFMLLPLAIRLNHRPCFLAFVYIAISSILKSYPSVGDSALYLGLLSLFVNELADMQFSFFLFSGYVGVSLLSPVMHNLWIWRGTGNANFYFATAMAYACFQIVLVVESVNAILNHDRKVRKLCTTTTRQMLLKESST